MTLKLRNLLLSMMILYSSLPSSMMWRNASSEGMFAKIALRHTGSPSWDISIFSSLAVMASYSTVGSSYSSGDVKWSWRKAQITPDLQGRVGATRGFILGQIPDAV